MIDKIKEITQANQKQLHIVTNSDDFNRILKETETYAYGLITKNMALIIGEGTGQRGFVIIPGRAVPGHIKWFIAALAHAVYKEECVRFIIPTTSKEQSRLIEKQLKLAVGFKDVSSISLTLAMLEERYNQINLHLLDRSIVNNGYFFRTNVFVQSGSEAIKLPQEKELSYSTNELYREFEILSKLIGSYYNNL